MRVGIIGAGPAGLTAAYVLAKAGIYVEVFEASDSVGGLAKTIELWNQKVDIGPHRFFSKDLSVNRLWLEVAQSDYRMIDRLTRIYYRNRFFYYPLKPFDALCKLGAGEALTCLASYLKAKCFPPPDNGTFESWVVRRFGRRLFEIFFKTYTEKLWGMSCTELSADFAAQRIKRLSLWEAVRNALFKSNAIYHKSLVDQFAYPLEGTGMVYQRMADFVESAGGRIHLRTPVESVYLADGNRVAGLVLQDGTRRDFDHIISTMPLTLLTRRIPNAPQQVVEAADGLFFRNTLLVYLLVDSDNLFPDNWLYIHSEQLKMGRVTNFRNWIPELYGNETKTILAIEYWCYDADPAWSDPDENLIKLASEEIKATGLLGQAQVVDGYVYRIPKCYPVYNRGYQEKLEVIQQYLDTLEGLTVIGRYGSFKYNNQDHSIMMGILAAENLLEGKQHNLWEINTDYEDYQESSVITPAGLCELHH